ncbi:unnamed protein product, partial [Ectocarpus sp. 12 AP-2014]
CRNYFGAQTSSFEVPLDTSALETGSVGKKDGDSANKDPYPAVFIRAPAVLEVKLAKRRRLAAFFVEPNPSTAAVAGEGGGAGSGARTGEKEAPEVIVAIRKGNIVGTAFHPELTNDSRWHEYFVRIVKEAVS